MSRTPPSQLRFHFPAGPVAIGADRGASPIRGGRAAALERLERLDPARYGRTRNHLDGAVSGLSPWIRHGVLSLAEVRDGALARVTKPASARKFVQELAWRDYYQRVWVALGDAVWDDVEPYKTGFAADDYDPELPPEIEAGATGIDWVDGFACELAETGWLHNHARMWLAAYVVHWRRVAWQAGARWFLRHLLDGDEASNNLSWQWVASTFSRRPYVFNRANLARYAEARFPSLTEAPAADDPFAGSYDMLARRLFRVDAESAEHVFHPASVPLPEGNARPSRPVVWVTADALGPGNPALAAHQGAPAVFVHDRSWIDRERIALKRLVFMDECLADLPVTVLVGDVAAEVVAFARAQGADGVVSTASADPRPRRQAAAIAAELPLRLLEPAPFLIDAPDFTARDLRRFSNYWRKAERAAFGRPRSPGSDAARG